MISGDGAAGENQTAAMRMDGHSSPTLPLPASSAVTISANAHRTLHSQAQVQTMGSTDASAHGSSLVEPVLPNPMVVSVSSAVLPVSPVVPVSNPAASTMQQSCAAPVVAPIAAAPAAAAIHTSQTVIPPEPPIVSSSGILTEAAEPRVLLLECDRWLNRKRKTQLNKPSSVDSTNLVSRPDWCRVVSSLERAVLPEWFDGSAAHRTPESYIKVRDSMMDTSARLGHHRFLTSTMIRRVILGDVGSLQRLHSFLRPTPTL